MKRYIIVLRMLWFFLTLVLLSSPLYADECSPFQFGLWSSIQLVPKDKVVCGVRLDLLWGDNAEVWGLDVGLVNIAGASKGLQMGGVNWLDSRGGSASWGIQAAGAMNYTNKISYTGAQIALGMNLNMSSEISGLQLAAINGGGKINGVQGGILNFSSDVSGAQLGVANGAVKMTGVQLGVANGADYMTGVQLGIGNGVDKMMTGVQLGVVNFVDEEMSGVQIGLINDARHSFYGVQIGLANTPWEGLSKATVNGVQLSLVGNVTGHVKGLQIGFVNICEYLTGVQIGLINVVYGSGSNAIPFFPIINFGWD